MTVRHFDVKTGVNLCTYKGHTDYVRYLELSTDELHIYSSSSDNTVIRFNTSVGKNE